MVFVVTNIQVSIPSLQLLPNRFIGHPGLAEMKDLDVRVSDVVRGWVAGRWVMI